MVLALLSAFIRKIIWRSWKSELGRRWENLILIRLTQLFQLKLCFSRSVKIGPSLGQRLTQVAVRIAKTEDLDNVRNFFS